MIVMLIAMMNFVTVVRMYQMHQHQRHHQQGNYIQNQMYNKYC